jgi:hypothetical protein
MVIKYIFHHFARGAPPARPLDASPSPPGICGEGTTLEHRGAVAVFSGDPAVQGREVAQNSRITVSQNPLRRLVFLSTPFSLLFLRLHLRQLRLQLLHLLLQLGVEK